MNTYEFVHDLYLNCRDVPKLMDIETAKSDLEMFRHEDNWHVPEDITPEEYMEIWNDLYEKSEMVRVVVNLIDTRTGAHSPIDIIEVKNDYTPEDYIEECKINGVEWNEGTIYFEVIKDLGE